MSNGTRILLAAALGIVLAAGVWMYLEGRGPFNAGSTPPAAPTPAPVAAGSRKLHKCEDAGGAISLQSAPCPAGSRTVWVRDVTPEPGDEPSAEITLPAPGDAAAPAPAAEDAPVSFACEMARGDLASYRAGASGPVDDAEVELREQTVEEACR